MTRHRNLPRELRLVQAVATLHQWAQDAANAPPVTAGNVVARVQLIQDRFGILAENLADLLESRG